MEKLDRLFVPLTTESYLDFKEKGKEYEVRACQRQFTECFVYPGRAVELRRGYSVESLWGVIGEVVIGRLEEIFEKAELCKLEPQANSIEEAVAMNRAMLGEHDTYIAFQVLDRAK